MTISPCPQGLPASFQVMMHQAAAANVLASYPGCHLLLFVVLEQEQNMVNSRVVVRVNRYGYVSFRFALRHCICPFDILQPQKLVSLEVFRCN
jgi:hypothetical protein